MSIAFVTGASGFIGRWLVKELLENGNSVIAVVRPGRQEALRWLPPNEKLEIVACDMAHYRQLPCLVGKHDGSIFYHLAWAGVSGADRTNLSVQLNNIKAGSDAVQAAAEIGCTRFVGMGSIMEWEVFQAAESTSMCQLYPNGEYGTAKLLTRLHTKTVAAGRGMDHLWAVLTNAYGEHEFSSRFIQMTIQKMLRHETLEFTSGTQIYDFIHVEDAARALYAIGVSGRSGHYYTIGSGHPAPLRRFIETIGALLSPERELVFGTSPYAGVHLPVKYFSIQKLITDTGFVPQISFEEGILRTANWLTRLGKV